MAVRPFAFDLPVSRSFCVHTVSVCPVCMPYHFLCLVSVRPCCADRSVSLLSQSVGRLSHPSCPPFLIWLYPPMKYQLIWLVFSVSPPVCFLCFGLSPILSASFVCSTVPRCPVCACPFATTLHLSWRTNCVPICCSSCRPSQAVYLSARLKFHSVSLLTVLCQCFVTALVCLTLYL